MPTPYSLVLTLHEHVLLLLGVGIDSLERSPNEHCRNFLPVLARAVDVGRWAEPGSCHSAGLLGGGCV